MRKVYIYNGKRYHDEEIVNEAIAEKLSEQGYNNQDVPSEHIADEWDYVEIEEEEYDSN